MRRTPITLLCLAAALAAPNAALAQEPEEPEPIPDFWTETEPTPSPEPPASSTSTSAPAPARQGPTPTEEPAEPTTEDDCDEQAVAGRAAKAARRALRKRPLLGTGRRKLVIRVRSCAAGDLRLRLLEAGTTTAVARGRATLVADRTAKLTLRMTPAGRRYERRVADSPDRRYELQLTARFEPA